MKIRAAVLDEMGRPGPYAQTRPVAIETIELDSPGPGEVLVKITAAGLCHSDLSMRNNEWGLTAYPFVGGHEIVGKVSAVGANARNVKVGQTVGVGWSAESCMSCPQCLGGDHNLCPACQGTIVKRHGGFAAPAGLSADAARGHVHATPLDDGRALRP